MKTALHLGHLPPQNPSPQSNHEKDSRLIPAEGPPATYLTSTPQNWSRSSKTRAVSERKTVSQPTTLLTPNVWIFHTK